MGNAPQATNLINLENVSLSFGIRPVLDSLSLGVSQGERIGIVGLNGGGKTTLLEVMVGLVKPDSGRVSHKRDLRIAVVTQRSPLAPGATVGEAVLNGLGMDTYEWASNARIRDILSGIGIVELGLETPVESLSGGERRRVALASALVQDFDLLVLDEPTNHLDVEGVQWLAEHILSRQCSLMVVTHDRWFLDTIATQTWEVVDGSVETYEGGYNDWVFSRAERARQAKAMESRRQNLIRKELAWLRRGAPARTSKPRYRIEAADALIANEPEPRDTVALSTFANQRLGKIVVELEDAALSTPDGRELVEDLTWRLAPGERIGLVGVNGSGKTTLLKTLAGDYPLEKGKRIQGKTVRLGWLKQELDDLPTDMRLLEAVEDIAGRVFLGDQELSAAQLAERLGFSPARQRTPVKDLSGGERRRLQLTRILMAEPNVLLLDEPTNDLDIDTLRQLEDILDKWPGTLVVISHDRYLIERIADTTWALFGDGKLTNLPGGIEQYLSRRKKLISTSSRSRDDVGSLAANMAPLNTTVSEKTDAQQESMSSSTEPSVRRSSAEERALRKECQRIERSISRLSDKEKDYHQKLADIANSAEGLDTERLVKCDKALKETIAEREALEEQWLELSAELEDN